jgi:Na+/melibiose symporter-like transporter
MILLNPPRKRWALRAVRPLMLMMMFPLSVLCAAMFTQPPIPQIEEVGRLVHISAK